jgi:two-component system, LuxR family, response regulator FixJ
MPASAWVHVIDDDDAVRDSLTFLLQANGFQVRAHRSGSDFLAALPLENPGCIISDIRMPGVSGTDVLARLREGGMDTPVIIMTGHGDVPLAVEAMKLGAFDFLEKPFDDEVMLTSVRSALERASMKKESEAEKDEIRRRIDLLTRRERDVLAGLITGHPNKIIAFNLSISPRTVEIYRANIMTKMQAGSLSELVRMVITSGIDAGPK